MKTDFKNKTVFARLEEDAIDGTLVYDDYPPCEYKYFSKLSKLGYMNRHKGWSAEICGDLQEKYRSQYRDERERFDRFFTMACTMQDNIKHGETLRYEIYKTKDPGDKLRLALQVIELMTCEDGFAKRNLREQEE